MDPEQLTIYEKPACTTCRRTRALLEQKGIEFEDVNFFTQSLSAAKIAELLDKSGITPRELLRPKDPLFKELGLKDSTHSDIELIELMAENPGLIQRPIAELGGKAVLCRPIERVLEIL